MFRNDRQIATCCKALLRRVRLDWVWNESGPTERGSAILNDVKENRSPLSSGEQLMLRVTLDFWNGGGDATLGRLLQTLDGENLRTIATLLIAVPQGPAAIDGWLAEAAP